MESVPNGVWEWLNALGPGERVSVIFLGMFALIMAIMIISSTIYKVHKNRLDDALKRELLERGMSAEEIATVIRARTSRRAKCGPHTT